MNDLSVKYIEHATWFKTLEHYPKTVSDISLMISIVDKMGIFATFDIQKIADMDNIALDIIYTILRITNKIYTKYIDHCVKKILVPELLKIIIQQNYNLPSSQKQIFIDQLVQDMDHFVSIIITSCFPIMVQSIIKNKFIEHLKTTFQRDFYKNISKKWNIDIGSNFYLYNDTTINRIVNDYIDYSNKILNEPYNTMKNFLQILFDKNNGNEKLKKLIMASFEKNINLSSLFHENCLEIDIYSEQKLHEDYKIMTNNEKCSTIKNAILNKMGYEIYSDGGNILKPFIDHKYAKNDVQMVDILCSVLTKHGANNKFIDNNESLTAREHFIIEMAQEYEKHSSYEKFLDSLSNKKCLPKKYPLNLILRIFSRIFAVRIKLINKNLTITDINNTDINTTNIMGIYCDTNNKYYTVYPKNDIFVAFGKNTNKTKYLTQLENKQKILDTY